MSAQSHASKVAPVKQQVAVIIPAWNEAGRIAATVRATAALPYVDLVLVVDDGSADATQAIARDSGAVVMRHPHNRGKAEAMQTGAAVVAMRDREGAPPRHLLFLDADLGDSAANSTPLIEAVVAGRTDVAIAVIPQQTGAGSRGFALSLARRSIRQATGFSAQAPMCGIRCLTRQAFEAVIPLAHGWGVETAMTIDLLNAGYSVEEIPCNLKHRASGSDLRGLLHRATQYRDVLVAVTARGVKSAARDAAGRVARA
ncbi:MAG: glycosyltransferase family 2 protein [Micrococcales bacterium]|nr:glycosyltransferase family 2 protein [Micrococcales bacterium]